jgi:hypothetical protein
MSLRRAHLLSLIALVITVAGLVFASVHAAPAGGRGRRL